MISQPSRFVAGQFVLALALFCSGCATKSLVHASDQRPSAGWHVNVPHSSDVDQLARFLAGLPGDVNSPYLVLERTDAWKQHAQASDRMWARFDRERLPLLQNFAKSQLAELSATNPVFYPFGGPDAVTPTTFFPNQSTYVLVGLEPPGTMAIARALQSKTLETDRLAERLRAIRVTLQSFLTRSFFITREMDQQLRGQATDGVLADILIELARRNNTILGIRELMVNAAGQVVDRKDPLPGELRNRGIALEFENREDHSIRQLMYFTINLADASLLKNKPIEEFLSQGRPFITFLKSTSYLPHQKQFSAIREQILANSAAILQDDSGVPYKFLPSPSWNVALFGGYDHPYGTFRYLVQKDLQQAYQEREKVRALPFQIGYGFGRIPSNLLFAVKRTATAQAN